MIETEAIISLFNLPLSQQAYAEFVQLHEDLMALNNEDVNDQWTYIWGDSSYSSRMLYKLVFAQHQAPRSVTWIWKSKCSPRFFFMWLLQADRLNTRHMLN